MNGYYGGQPVQGNSYYPINTTVQNPSGYTGVPYTSAGRVIQRVDGEAGIKAYQLYPNESIIAVDTTADDVLQIKACDGTGFPTIRKIKFTFEDQPQITSGDYVSRKDFDELSEKLNKLLKELGNDESNS